jgi:hypothetical protein
MIEAEAVNAYLKSPAASKASPLERHTAVMRLICLCLRAVPQLPEPARGAFDVAQAFWLDGRGIPRALDAACEQCWQHLESMGATTTLTSPEVVATRAVICALYPEPQGEDFDEDTLDWFVRLLNRLGDYSEVFSRAARANR